MEEYEYAVVARNIHKGKDDRLNADEWGTLDAAELELYGLQTHAYNWNPANGVYPYEFRIVKRRKAGTIEEME